MAGAKVLLDLVLGGCGANFEIKLLRRYSCARIADPIKAAVAKV
jgi:hypothetical protein